MSLFDEIVDLVLALLAVAFVCLLLAVPVVVYAKHDQAINAAIAQWWSTAHPSSLWCCCRR